MKFIKENQKMISFFGKIRYFTPYEVSKFMCFPNDFTFPEITDKIKYKLLGNSINVIVVKTLMEYLL